MRSGFCHPRIACVTISYNFRIPGILDPDPWKRWTATQVAQHPFLVGGPIVRKRDRPATAQFNKDENQANIICDIYWEAPWDPNICRRKLLNVQKIREKQQTTRRGFSSRNSRPSGASAHDSPTNMMHESPRGVHRAPPEHTGPTHDRQAGLGTSMTNSVPGVQLSSSFTDYANGTVGGDNASIVSGPLPQTSGPLSYSEVGYPSGFLQNSFNEVDFAYALQRPGVVPMGESSVASSVDMSISQQQLMGSIGVNNRNHLRTASRRASAGTTATSRSYGEMHDVAGERGNGLGFGVGSVGTAPGGLGHQSSASMQMAAALPQQPPGSVDPQIPSSLGQQLPFGSQGSYANGAQTVEDPMLQTHMHQDPTMMANNLQQQLAYGNAQAYLQQQHAALQQQQLLLQQQQAALALQQQQLQVYGLSPGMVNSGAVGGPAMLNPGNAQQFGGMNQLASANTGYYYVTSADGTPMMVAASAGYGIPQQAVGFEASPSMGNVQQQGALDPSLFYQPDSAQFRGGGM